jgi:hypothetical protein
MSIVRQEFTAGELPHPALKRHPLPRCVGEGKKSISQPWKGFGGRTPGLQPRALG